MTDPAEFVSFVVPTADDAPEAVQETVTSLLALDLPAYEVLVVDGGTRDEALWRPVEEFCRSYGVEFRHIPVAAPSREEAVRFAGLLTHPRSQRVEVVEPGVRYAPAGPVPLGAPPEPGSPRRGAVTAALLVLAVSAVGGLAIAGDLIPDSEPGVTRPAVADEPSRSPDSPASAAPREIPSAPPPFVPLPLASPTTSAVARPASAPTPAPSTAPVRPGGGATGGPAPAPQQPGTTTSTPPPPPATPAPSTPPPSQQPQPQPSASEPPASPSPSPSPSRKPKRGRG